MIFFKQLKLLCWKNLTLQRRQKKRLLTEILWPLALFLILLWVRTTELKLYYDECHFEQKAMPSAGIIPWLQTYLCTMNNTCQKHPVEVEDEIMTLYNNSLLTEMLHDLARFTREQLTADNKQLLQTLLKNLMMFDEQEFNQEPPTSPLVTAQYLLGANLFSLPAKVVPLDEIVRSEILQIERIWSAAQTTFGKHLTSISEATKITNDTNHLVNRLVCGRDNAYLLTGINYTDANDTLAAFSDRFKKVERALRIPPANENKINCDEYLYSFFGVGVNILKNLLKPIIEGTILYHPDTPSTRKLMDRVNQTFDVFATMYGMSGDWLKEIYPKLKKLLNDNAAFASLLDEYSINKASAVLSIEIIDAFMSSANLFFYCFEFNKVQPIKSGVNAMAEQLNSEDRLWALVEFVDPNKYRGDKLPKFIKYEIRMDAYRTAPTRTLEKPPPPAPRRSPLGNLQFLYFGFSFLQDMLDRAIIAEQTNKTIDTGLWVQQFPFPCFLTDRFIVAIAGTLPLFMVLSWVYTAAMLIRSIVYEKEYRLRETMRIMGLGNLVYWLSWFILALITILISLIILALVLKFGNILTFSDPLIVFLFLLCFAISTISLSFLLSTFFNKANMAAAAGGLIYFFLYLPYAFLLRWQEHLSGTIRQGVSLSSNVAMGFGCTYIANLEQVGIGLHWDNFAGSEDMPEYYFTVLDSMEMLLIDSVIYFIVALYIEAVFPGTYGLPQPWYCCVQPILCCFRKNKMVPDDPEKNDTNVKSLDFEAEPTHLPLGIVVKNLRKVYSGGKVAVHDVTLNFYEGQITAFLGQNGAGKTTTISILTGLFPPTSGTAIISGYDIHSQMSEVRGTLGMCPQFNVLFDELTVYEHLWFYANLKHSNKTIAVDEEIFQLITDVGLTPKINVQAKNLSGGMLRKLSVAVAFIGGSKVIILDEPTAGVDPQARRAIWDLLVKYKKGKTIVLTTHFMDEADILGDRIAIMSNGKIGCCGSSLFLKKRFGKGYYLTAIKKDANDTSVATKMTDFIQKFVPNATLKEDVGYEMTFILPFDNVEKFKPLLDSLNNDKDKLGITEFGISDSKLEEIFLKVCESVENAATGNDDVEPRHVNDVAILRKISGLALMIQQSRALSLKKFYNATRNLKSKFAEIVLPAIFICAAFIMTVVIPPITSYPPMELHLYHQAKKNYIFFKETLNKSDLTRSYIDSLVTEPHLGTRCVTGEPLEMKCIGLKDNPSKLKAIQPPFLHFNEPCPCVNGTMNCRTENPNLPTILLGTDDYLINATSQNITNWIIRTHKIHYLNRQGGYTIHRDLETRINWCDWLDLWQAAASSSYDDDVCKLPADHGNIKVWFNNRNFESVTAYFNAINNVILRAALMDRNDSKSYGISAINNPLSFSAAQAYDSVRDYGFFTLLQAVSIVFAMSFVPASFALFLINERISKFKHLQIISGVKPIVYWVVNFFWDFVTYMITVVLCILIFVTFDDTGYTSNKNFTPVVLLLVCYGLASIPLMYAFSFAFSIPSLAFVVLSCTNLFIGIATTLSTYVLQIFEYEDDDLRDIYIILRQVFLVFPQYCLGRGLIELKTHQQAIEALEEFGFVSIADPFDWDFVGRNIVCLLIICVVSFFFTIMIEYKFFYKSKQNQIADSIAHLRINEDEDVAAERDKILGGVYDDAVLRVQNIEKIYSSNSWISKIKNFFRTKVCRKSPLNDTISLRAVDYLSFGVNKGECFGLLGANGAGKTTLFKMLTGDVMCTSGNAYLLGYSIRTQITQVREHLGYCPQFDALNAFLTCEEHLKLFAGLKGIHRRDIDKAVDWTVKTLNFESHFHKRAGTYSGGNKRKLCTAIAIIGYPPIIYLDEPTTGMDPKSRRFLWNCILSLMKSGQSVVLTSHSLEECEALCTRLAIMVTGRFRCFGTVQYLKNRLGGGYYLTIRAIDAEYMPNIFAFINEHFPKAIVKEHHSNYAQFSFPQSDVILSVLFEQMEKNKVLLGIADYSLSQTTLDQVFLSIASTDV